MILLITNRMKVSMKNILLENEAPYIKKNYLIFCSFFYTYTTNNAMPNTVLYTNNHDPN